MAIKVIRRGTPPEEIEYEQECVYCNSLLKYAGADVHHDQRDGSYLTCPVCSKGLTPTYKTRKVDTYSDYWQNR